jgi:hypothetical protein
MRRKQSFRALAVLTVTTDGTHSAMTNIDNRTQFLGNLSAAKFLSAN